MYKKVLLCSLVKGLGQVVRGEPYAANLISNDVLGNWASRGELIDSGS